MKRSEINAAIVSASRYFIKHHWILPPSPSWDVTDFGLGDFRKFGLILINLALEDEYCEKLMYAAKDMVTPCHAHKKKKEDIIVREGVLAIRIWNGAPSKTGAPFQVKVNGKFMEVNSGDMLLLLAGERVTLTPGIYHEFWPESDECILGEVSTANDDLHDNFFINPEVGRFSEIDEDEPPLVKLVGDRE
ncbi:MAG TPA: D-lyxose/D-mannose family sugar isomerase [Cyclobacteriaceae bacterium]|nr:D-lyxose/D-mannose family sugar isomerase [Cyclobacteriaceae bacterium]